MMVQLLTRSGERDERGKQRTEKDAKYAIIREERQETFEQLRKTFYTYFILRYIRFDWFSFTNISSISCLIIYTNDVRDLTGGFCLRNGRTKINKFQRRETKMIDSQNPHTPLKLHP